MKKYVVYENINWRLDCSGNIWGVHMCNTYNDYMPTLFIGAFSAKDKAEKCVAEEFEKEFNRLREDGCDSRFQFVGSGYSIHCIPRWIEDDGEGGRWITDDMGVELPDVWILTVGIMEIDV